MCVEEAMLLLSRHSQRCPSSPKHRRMRTYRSCQGLLPVDDQQVPFVTDKEIKLFRA